MRFLQEPTTPNQDWESTGCSRRQAEACPTSVEGSSNWYANPATELSAAAPMGGNNRSLDRDLPLWSGRTRSIIALPGASVWGWNAAVAKPSAGDWPCKGEAGGSCSTLQVVWITKSGKTSFAPWDKKRFQKPDEPAGLSRRDKPGGSSVIPPGQARRLVRYPAGTSPAARPAGFWKPFLSRVRQVSRSSPLPSGARGLWNRFSQHSLEQIERQSETLPGDLGIEACPFVAHEGVFGIHFVPSEPEVGLVQSLVDA